MPRGTRRAGKKRSHKSKKRHHRRGGDAGSEVNRIASDFGMVKHSYGDIVGKFLDDDVGHLREYMEENENSGTLTPDAFFFGKTDDGKFVVIVSEHANKDILKRLRELPSSTSVYVTGGDVEYSMGDGWDHAVDTGLVTSRSFSLSGEFDDDGIEYEVYFNVDGSYSESEDPRATKRGSWDKGAGNLRVWSNAYTRAPAATRKTAVASMASLSRMGLDADLADEVAKGLHLKDKVPKGRIDLRITESNIYTPDGDMSESFKFSSDTEEQLSDAREEYERMLPIIDARMREEAEQQRQWEEEMSRPYQEDYYDDYGYGYDDDRYGGRRRRSTEAKRTRQSMVKRATRRRR